MADDLDKETQNPDFDFNDEDDGFGDVGSESIGTTIQNNVAVKIAIIAGAFIFIIGGFILFGGSEEKQPDSGFQAGGASINETPGGEEALPDSYKEALEEYNEVGIETAIKEQESFIPVPTEPTTDTSIVVPEEDELQEDPLERWRILQEQRARQQQQQLEINRQVTEDASEEDQRRQEAVQTLAQSMLDSMQQLSDISYIRKIQSSNITDSDYYDKIFEEDDEANELEGMIDSSNVGGDVIVPEGEIEYAQMLIQANSDIPGPVLAQIVTGPLAGSRIIGSFSTEFEYLVITFNTVVIDGQSVPINAVAVDPDTNLTGVATEVDKRYFTRLVLPVAANFIEGLAGAIAQTQTSTTTSTSVTSTTTQDNELDTDEEIASAIEDAGEEISEFVEEEADNTEILVKVDAGTPIGILFLEPLLEGDADGTTASSSTPQFVTN